VGLINTLEAVCRHPLNRRAPFAALWRFGRWQMSQRLFPRRAVVPWVSGTRLIVGAGETGLTGNLYCGLHEFTDMAFVLHYLRHEDLFVDVGANAGSYTVLAAGAARASVVSIEPVPSTFERLMDQVHVNRIQDRVRALNCAVGDSEGEVRFSADSDTMNHVLRAGETSGSEVIVPVHRLDDLMDTTRDCFIKLDVEGYEMQALAGAAELLKSGRVAALLVELNGSGAHYGSDDAAIDSRLRGCGLAPFSYSPFDRKLHPAGPGVTGNTLYLRDAVQAQARVRAAAHFTVGTRLL
jgi:FkbM family methyltransferase